MGRKWDITPHVKGIEEKLASGCSVRMIAADLGINHSTLSTAMKEYGLSVPTRGESMRNAWKNHNHPRLGKRGAECPVYGKKMSESTKQKLREANTGPNNYHWSGGRKKHSGGYVLVYSPKHPARDQTGFVLEHRLVMEEALGRILTSDEIVHHINGDKQDNRLSNLFLTNRADHARHHINNNGGMNYVKSNHHHGPLVR